MPRYLVQRTFADHLEMPTNAEGANAAASSSPTLARTRCHLTLSFAAAAKLRVR